MGHGSSVQSLQQKPKTTGAHGAACTARTVLALEAHVPWHTPRRPAAEPRDRVRATRLHGPMRRRSAAVCHAVMPRHNEGCALPRRLRHERYFGGGSS
eukprot:4821908-Prymnesium_polylepis.1